MLFWWMCISKDHSFFSSAVQQAFARVGPSHF